MEEKIKVTINGEEIETSAGKTILEVVNENDLDEIPTLCYSPELEPYGSCFVCVVEIKGKRNLVPSCATGVADGMEIETNNQRVISARKMALELLCSNHYADCVSPCMEGCPAGVDAQGYIALSAMGEYVRAVDLIRETNPLPAICGRVCVRKCEVVCRRQDVDESVAINNIKRFVSDIEGIYDRDPRREPETGKSVGIVGSGPAGLTAAWFLGRKGHKPVLYEAQERSGGMLRYGIPEYRLPDDVMDAEVDYICRAGAEIRYNTRVGRDITLEKLRDEHDAVFLASGAWVGKPMRVEGEDETEGVVRGAEFLREKADNPEPVSGTVIVVGGGNTAMDVARTCWRLGADKVIVLYRRTKAEMPADEMEIEDCLDEGIELMELASPVGIIKDNGKLKALRCIKMKLGEPDDSGRRRPVPLEGSEFDFPCDLAVPAIGQSPDMDGLTGSGGEEIDFTRWNTFIIDTETMETNLEGVYAGGDAADDGPTVVIDAIRDGQRAAKAIDAYITGENRTEEDFRIEKGFWQDPGKKELGEVRESPRHELNMLDVEKRKGSFDEVATGFDYEDNVHECDRCLSCGCLRYYDCDLRLQAEKYDVDMNEFKGYARKHKVDDRHPYVVYDPNKCVLCARCIRTCERVLPISALGLVNRGFKTEMRPALNDPLVETSCISCGNCVDSCPTGALTIKYPFPGRAALYTDKLESHCAFCSLGCPITVNKISDSNYFIGSSDTPGEYLCRYGRFGNEIFIKKERLDSARISNMGVPEKADCSEAARFAAGRLREAAAEYGPESVAVFVSPDLTNEEMYLASGIAREGLGTNNIASLSMLAGGMEAGVLDESLGFTGSTTDRKAVRDADLIICNNTSIETDHLILSVEVIEAVKKRGARLIVSNSALDYTDRTLASLVMDPMRGRAALLWKGVIAALQEKELFGPEFLENREALDDIDSDKYPDLESISGITGVDQEKIVEAAEIISSAQKIVLIHSPDRPQDRAEGDLKTLANLMILLRKAGMEADILLPQGGANSAGIEIMGADPSFAPGRVKPSGGLEGATSRAELREMLDKGEIKAAMVIGEDPMSWVKTESWFVNIDFLTAMDWTETETTRMADVVLPGSTYLETAGTRCNFEGRVIQFNRAVEPAASVSGREVLLALAESLGIEPEKKLTEEIERVVSENMEKQLIPYYWNTGQDRPSIPVEKLVRAHLGTGAPAIPQPLTQYGRYKQDIINVGIKHYKVI
ncbi:MAG: molybdopterin-dependent oxidoreductase [Candidatus Latescibacteria bacterium]|nr:molybdopterin-dependent oxidoreductase [bacterium]MBD3424077.1 molybdopterin-dependent oxidoreductase [Candidatus Latescibacterota bacterium]